jgi:methanogenic corrinoid protein MtbC1
MTNSYADTLNKVKLELPILIQEMVDRQYVLQPEFHKYGDLGRLRALEDAKYNLDYLFSAIEIESPLLFTEYNKWTNQLFTHLKMPTNTLSNFYRCSLEVFNEFFSQAKLDLEFYSKLKGLIEEAIKTLEIEFDEGVSELEIKNPLESLLRRYSQLVHSGDKAAAIRYFEELANGTLPIKEIYRYIIQPFQVELGKLWHENQITVAEEHYATGITQFAMSMLYKKIFETPKKGKVLLGTCAQGELHELGIRMVCDYMESCGWDTYYLGANMPERAVLEMIADKKPDVIAVSCTMVYNVPKVKSLIDAIKRLNINTPIIVGGYPFIVDENLWNKVGASGYSFDFEEAELISEQLT